MPAGATAHLRAPASSAVAEPRRLRPDGVHAAARPWPLSHSWIARRIVRPKSVYARTTRSYFCTAALSETTITDARARLISRPRLPHGVRSPSEHSRRGPTTSRSWFSDETADSCCAPPAGRRWSVPEVCVRCRRRRRRRDVRPASHRLHIGGACAHGPSKSGRRPWLHDHISMS